MTGPEDREIRAAAERVAARLLGEGLVLATAESCTGGWIAKACTDLPGSSRWFVGGAVTYADAVKSGLLGVDPEALRRHGAVSEAVVRQMAVGAIERFGANFGVAVSGIAGPDGGSPEKPVGTVWLAWVRRRDGQIELVARREHFSGDRDTVRRATVLTALEGLLGP